MELLYIKSSKTPILFETERQIIKTGILLSHKLNAVTPNLASVSIYNNRDVISDRSIIKNYCYFFSSNPANHSKAEMDIFFKELSRLRNKKFKNRVEVLNLGHMENSMKIITKDALRCTVQTLADFKLDSIVDFENDKSLIIFDEGLEINVNEYFYQQTLLEELVNPEMMHLLGVVLEMDKEERAEIGYVTPPKTDWIFTNKLFTIPCLDSLSYAQMKIMRNEFHDILQPFYSTIAALKQEFEAIVLTVDNIEYLEKRFDELIEPQMALMKEAMNTNMYFQQIANSAVNPQTYNFNISFCTMKTMVLLYLQGGVITDMEHDILLEKLALTKNLNNAIVFFDMAESTIEGSLSPKLFDE